jgi:hypothetical protein
MHADERMTNGLRVAILLVKQKVPLPAPAVFIGAVLSFEAVREALRKRALEKCVSPPMLGIAIA